MDFYGFLSIPLLLSIHFRGFTHSIPENLMEICLYHTQSNNLLEGMSDCWTLRPLGMFNIEKPLPLQDAMGHLFHLECRIKTEFTAKISSRGYDTYNYIYIYRNIISIKCPLYVLYIPMIIPIYLLVQFISSSSRARPFR